MENENTISVTECAKLLGMSNLILRFGIESHQLPFGECIDNTFNGGVKNYIIPRKQFEKWYNGDYMNEFMKKRSKKYV